MIFYLGKGDIDKNLVMKKYGDVKIVVKKLKKKLSLNFIVVFII